MTPDTGQFSLERRYPVAPEKLWHLLTDAAMREQWGAPSEGTVLVVEASDLREGGIDRHRCGPAEAPEFHVETRWYRLDAPHLAAFTETVDAAGARIATSLVTYRLEAEAGGTVLGLSVATSSYVGAEALADFEGGWTAGLANLDRLVAALPAETAALQ